MTRVDITIVDKTGFDTRYLFPGSVAHSHERTEHVTGGTFWYFHDLKIGGKTVHHRFEVNGIIGDANGDLGGQIAYWRLPDPKNANFLLGMVELDHTATLDGFSRLTPDRLALGIITDNQTPEFHYLGNTGNDTLRGSFADDELDGGKGGDRMIGRDGDDTYRVDNKNDKVVEAKDEGDDQVYVSRGFALPRNVEDLLGTGSRGLALTGNGGQNDISGTIAADTIRGLGGNDLIAAGNGKDVLYGGKGKDFFMFTVGPAKSNVDTIKDFKHSADTIMLSHLVFAVPTSGTNSALLSPDAFHASKSGRGHDSGDRIYYDTDDRILYYDADGTGTAAARQVIARFDANPHLAADDFLVI